MAEKMIQQLYVTETLEEVRKSYLSINFRKYGSLITISIFFLVFAFVVDPKFKTTFWIILLIGVFEFIWYFVSVYMSTNKIMKQYEKLDPKPTKVTIYDKHLEIYIESNANPIDNKVPYDEMDKILYIPKQQAFVFYKRKTTFSLPIKDLKKDTIKFLNTKLKR